jgi:hypothetical protein
MKTREAVLTALETQAVISKPRPNPRIRRFLATVHKRGCRCAIRPGRNEHHPIASLRRFSSFMDT